MVPLGGRGRMEYSLGKTKGQISREKTHKIEFLQKRWMKDRMMVGVYTQGVQDLCIDRSDVDMRN